MYRKVSVVPLHSITAPRCHDVKPLKHDGRDDIQTPQVEPLLVLKLWFGRSSTRRGKA